MIHDKVTEKQTYRVTLKLPPSSNHKVTLKRLRDARYYKAHREDRRRKRRWFVDNLNILKRTQGCDDCDKHEGLLDHHHLDPSTKKYDVAYMYTNSIEAFMDEIAKCAVLCRACHLSRHPRTRAKEGMWIATE